MSTRTPRYNLPIENHDELFFALERKVRHIGVSALASSAGISRSYLSNMLNESRAINNKVANALGYNIVLVVKKL